MPNSLPLHPAVTAPASCWWKEGVVYQIYPRSFQDSNGDGIGDLQGIISRLDYLKELGIDIIWLNPVYRSPNDDNGYDISDYQDIMAEFGTMDDWRQLLDELHVRGIRLIMDLVVNHSSDEHAWFVASRSGRDNPMRDYYIWRPGKKAIDGTDLPPNNWGSVFGGSAWQKDDISGEFYLHLFSKKQPDFNWENPELREKLYDMMRWWLDQGIDGFRMDVINFVAKHPNLPDAKTPMGNGYYWGGDYFMNQDHCHELLQEMHHKVLAGRDVMTVGECGGTTPEQGRQFSDPVRNELSMIFQFEHVSLDVSGSKWNIKPWKLTELKQVLNRWQTGLDGQGWNSLYLMNHDQPRALSRFGNDRQYRVESAKLLATLNLLLQGTPYIYQGEEIGMTNMPFASFDDYRDLESLNYIEEAQAQGFGNTNILSRLHYMSRDNSRTPMQWDDVPQAGFSTGKPWIAINPNYRTINVAAAKAEPDSIYHYYRELLQFRKEHKALIYGHFELLYPDHETLFAYYRHWHGERWLILLNFSDTKQDLPVSLHHPQAPRLQNYKEAGNMQHLRPWEARVLRVG